MQFTKIKQNLELPKAIIVDIDGTIADKWSRSPYDFSRVSEDEAYSDMVEFVQVLSQNYEIVFVSGRWKECFSDTFEWLRKYFPSIWIELYMRAEGDNRNDSIVKYEILKQLTKEYYISYVLDDRDRVVKMWREAGLRCLQVAEWNF